MADEERLLNVKLRYQTDAASLANAKKGAVELSDVVGAMSDDFKRLNPELVAAQKQIAAGSEQAATGLRRVRSEAEQTRFEMRRLRQNALELQQIGTALITTGGLIAGPFVAAAAAYVSQAGRAEETSRRWAGATERIKTAYQDVGRVTAGVLLPYLERAAGLAERAARYAEQHPEAVQAALGLGGGLVALGTLGTIAAQGIRLYADVKLLAAAALQNTAADKMLLAAGQQAGAAGVSGVAGVSLRQAGLIGALTGLALVIGQLQQNLTDRFLSNTERARGVTPEDLGPLYLMARDYFTKNGLIGVVQGEFSGRYGSVTQGPAALGPVVGAAISNVLSPILTPFSHALEGLLRRLDLLAAPTGQARSTNQLQARPTGVALGSFSAAVPLFAAYQEQLAQSEQDYGRRRIQIVQDYVARGLEIEQQYQSDRLRLQQDFAKSTRREARDFAQSEARAAGDYADRLALQLRDFAQNEARTEANYYEARLKRARDFDIETQRAEEDHQARLLELQTDHADRARDLAGAQDALGLVKEQRRYEKERQQEEQNYAKDTSRRNADYARELADNEAAFAEQREQRLADFEQQQQDQKDAFEKDRAERRADYAQRRQDEREDFQQRLADFDDQHRQIVDKNAANFEDDLRTLDSQHKQEKDKLAQDFKDKLNDLDAALLGEQKKRQDYYKRMAIDLQDFLEAARHGGDYKPRPDNAYPTDGGNQSNSIPKRQNVDPATALLAQTTSGSRSTAALTVNFANAFQGAAGQGLLQAVKTTVEQQLTAAFDQFAAQAGAG